MNKDLLSPLIGLCIVSVFVIYGTVTWFQLDDSIDYSILHNLIMTNQTFVDEMDCKKVLLTLGAVKNIISPTQQNEVNQLVIDFENLKVEKNCK